LTLDGSNSQAEGKPVRESQVVMARQMMPDDANPWGDVHGGAVMKMVDEAAGSAAIRHARCRVATAAIDYMSFLHPVHVGDMVTVCASVNDEVVHGIPGPRVIHDGDLVSLDCGLILDGWWADSGLSVACGEASPEVRRVIDVAHAYLRQRRVVV